MAGFLKIGDFCIPTQFFVGDNDEVNKIPKSFGSSSDPSSIKTESEVEEDYLVTLTREVARYTLEDDFVVKDKNTEVEQSQQQQLVWGDSNNKPQPNRALGFACPPMQQQQNGSGLFLGNPTGIRESVGTGVFLPQPINRPRKKQGRSTALVPARVVEALDLNVDEINAQAPLRLRVKANVANDNGAVSKPRRGGNGGGSANPKQRKVRAEQGSSSQEIRLPKEWTY